MEIWQKLPRIIFKAKKSGDDHWHINQPIKVHFPQFSKVQPFMLAVNVKLSLAAEVASLQAIRHISTASTVHAFVSLI